MFIRHRPVTSGSTKPINTGIVGTKITGSDEKKSAGYCVQQTSMMRKTYGTFEDIYAG
jgi:hypothetical protein